MSAETTVKILSSKEISNLKLDKGKFYMQSFLINDLQNTASDPAPFKVHRDSVAKISKTAIGRPFILPPVGERKHVTGPTRELNAILEYQKQFAMGEIVREYVNPQTNNANVIFEVYPDFVQAVKSGEITIPPFVSPLLIIDKENDDGEVVDGRIIHLQAVDTGGYGEIARINGACEGELNQCVNSLRVMGASGTLKTSQPCRKQFSNMQSNNTNDMQPEEVSKLIDSKFADFEKKIVGSVGEVVTSAMERITSKDGTQTLNPLTDADTQKEIDSLKATIATKEQELQAEKDKTALEKRTQTAVAIVEKELLLHAIPLKEKDDRVKHYVELKEDGQLVPLNTIKSIIEAQAKKISGSSGATEAHEVPQYAGASGETNNTDYDSFFNTIRSEV